MRDDRAISRKLRRIVQRVKLVRSMLIGPWRAQVSHHVDLDAALAAWNGGLSGADLSSDQDLDPSHERVVGLYVNAKSEVERLSELYLALAIRVAELERVSDSTVDKLASGDPAVVGVDLNRASQTDRIP